MYFRREGLGGNYLCGQSPTEQEEPRDTNLEQVIQGYRDTGIQIYRDTGIQRYRDTEIHGYKDAGIQRYGDTKIQGYKDMEIQRYRDTLFIISEYAHNKDYILYSLG